MCETYSGWVNRETWAFMLWVENDEGLGESAREVVKDAREGFAFACDALQEFAETLFTRAGYVFEFDAPWPDDLADIASDIGSLYRIVWRDCVDALAPECADCGAVASEACRVACLSWVTDSSGQPLEAGA